MNQAIGRVIRHKDDYGAILLCDDRFRYPNNKSDISTWIQNQLNQSSISFDTLTRQLSQFFENAKQTVFSKADGIY